MDIKSVDPVVSEEVRTYVPPTVTVSGDATALTRGSAGNNNADDTQYYE